MRETGVVGSSNTCWADMPKLVAGVQEIGARLAMPYIAAQSDLGDPSPMADEAGNAYAESEFRWIDPGHRYWLDRKLALSVPFLTAARLIAEPFYYTKGRLYSWRHTALLDGIDCSQVPGNSPLVDAVIAPVHLPRGVVGAVVWCAGEDVAIAESFGALANDIHATAYRFISTHTEARSRPRTSSVPQSLTRREVQCLRWAAAGKTDGEIGIILSLSVSTVRFHLRNAAGKLGATGRAQAIQIAAGLGFIGSRIA